MKQNKPILFFVFLLFSIVLIACNTKQKQTPQKEQIPEKPTDEIVLVERFPELIEGEIELDENCFGEIIERTGEQQITNEIFSIKEAQMLVKDSLLVVKNLSQGNLFMIFSLPEFKLVKTLGKKGKGPDEFQFPNLVPADGNDCICYVQERATNTLYELKHDLTFNKLDFKLADSQTKKFIGDKQIHSFSPNDFVYVESIKRGKAVFRYKIEDDSTECNMIQNLSFSDSHKSWASYIGDFGACKSRERMVFAYKYFKRLTFVDTKTGKVRTLNFDLGEAKKGNANKIMSPQNITHYWGMSAQKEFVYVLYSGRAPVDVVKDQRKENYYIYVEQFDWNGNPIKKYKLDNWGYFCVDEQNQKLYLASTNHAEAFFEYDLK